MGTYLIYNKFKNVGFVDFLFKKCFDLFSYKEYKTFN